MKKIDRIKAGVYVVFRLLFIAAGVFAAMSRNWIDVVLVVISLLIISLPSIVEKKFKVEIPSEFEIILILFIFVSIFLGNMRSFYDRIPWWDLLLHSLAAAIIGIIGFLLVNFLNRSKVMHIKLSPVFVAIFSFSFAMSMVVAWEIIEFLIDTFLGFNMQRGSLKDTMEDLIIGLFGALAISFFGYLYLRGNRKVKGRLDAIISRYKRFNK